MSSAPLDADTREKLKTLMMKATWKQTAKEWGIDRGTIAEAALGLPKASSTRYLIEGKLKEMKKPI